MASLDEPREPGILDLLDVHRDAIVEGINVMLPGKVVAYDSTKQLADVQPLIKIRHLAEDGETIVVEPMAVVHNCPVEFCGTARGRITWPVAVGDTCEIRFASASLARWVQQGGLVDPGDDRRHDISDGVCFVGLHDAAHVPTTAPTDAVVIHVSGGTKIKLGGPSASQAVVVQSALGDFMNALAAAIVAQAANPPGLAALQALQTALSNLNTGTGWKAGTSNTVAS